MTESPEEQRRKARATWPVRRTTLAEQDHLDDLAGTDAADRVSMIWQLTRDAYAFDPSVSAQFRLRRDVVRAFERGR